MTNSPKNPVPEETGKVLPSSNIHKILAVLLAGFVLLKIVMVLVSPRPSAQASDLTIDNILQAVNRERSLRNLVTLNTDGRLSSAAQSKADDMQARHYFAHVDPDGNYIWPKIVAAGYTPYLQLGENLAIEFYDTESLMAAWMNSPTHRANILNDGFVDQGMGLNFGNVDQGQYHSIVVNTFGALLIKKSSASQPPQSVSGATTPPSSPTPTKPKTAPVVPKPTPPVVVVTPTTPPQTITLPLQTSTPQTVVNPVAPRGNFALAPGGQQATTTASSSVASPSNQQGVVNSNITNPVKTEDINRYFTLAFGVVLLLFLITDLSSLMESRPELAGKKLTNIVLLLLALVVVAVMYWL